MNEPIFFISLIVLTIMHVIGDFKTPYRNLGVDWNWFGKNEPSWKNLGFLIKSVLLSEWVLVLNPMHGVWDKWSPLRRHPRYLKPYNLEVYGDTFPSCHHDILVHLKAPEGVHAPSWYAQNCQFMTTDRKFWVWLGIDQAYHMLSNVFLAWVIAVLI